MTNAALWQVQSGAGTGAEATAGDTHTIDFNATTKVPSDGPFISDISVDFRRSVPENEAVAADNNELQDMGIDGLDITLEGIIGDADNDATGNAVNKLSKWLQDGNTVTGYTKGRYGLKLDNAPQWNVVPTTTYGYHIRDIKLQYMGENRDLVHFTIRLALGGDVASAI
jgi:hypothetical protein|tara:strand:+ start:408 stop:914 length:507 start_codon:yes stop_codon:yes gene_type:complete